MNNNNIPMSVREQLARHPGLAEAVRNGAVTDIHQLPDSAHPGLAHAKATDFGHTQYFTGAIGSAIAYNKRNGNWKPVTDVMATMDPTQFLIFRSSADIPMDMEERDEMVETLRQLGADVSRAPANAEGIAKAVQMASQQRELNTVRETYAEQLRSEQQKAAELSDNSNRLSNILDALEG